MGIRSLCLGFCVCATLTNVKAAPVVTKDGPVQLNWTNRTLSVVGVGAPTLLSPTATKPGQDSRRTALEDAKEKIKRAWSTLHGHGWARTPVPEDQVVKEVRFGDGTVHLTLRRAFFSQKNEASPQVIFTVPQDLSPSLRTRFVGPDGQALPALEGAALIYVREPMTRGERQTLLKSQPATLDAGPYQRPVIQLESVKVANSILGSAPLTVLIRLPRQPGPK